MAQKQFTMLENNPDVMNSLAAELGLAPALVPRPVHALLVTIPMTPAWGRMRDAEDAGPSPPAYAHAQSAPVIWFKQTIADACGSIGLIHCLLNSPAAAAHIGPTSTLARIRDAAAPMENGEARARVLVESVEYEEAHRAAAHIGQSAEPLPGAGDSEPGHGNHFVAFVKGADGQLWELEGSRRGPLARGMLGEDEDALSEKALELGLRRAMEIGKADAGGDLRFSCVALAPALQ